MSEYARPLPARTQATAPYWEAAQRGQLVLQHCLDCAKPWFPPSEACAHCLGDRFQWRSLSGRGVVWSWIQMWQKYFPGFEDESPYNVALIELEEGPRLFTNLVDCEPAEIRCDMPVEVVFDQVTDAVTLPKFRPRRD
jgi:uncharacterized OB-fold protein